MPTVTYHVVVAFDQNAVNELRHGEPMELLTPEAAVRLAKSMSLRHAGAVTFSRTGDPAIGEFADGVVLFQAGEVDLEALAAG